MSRPKTASYLNKPSPGATILTVGEYVRFAHDRTLINSDGIGYAMRDGLVANTRTYDDMIKPSREGDDIPEDATHIVWFNK